MYVCMNVMYLCSPRPDRPHPDALLLAGPGGASGSGGSADPELSQKCLNIKQGWLFCATRFVHWGLVRALRAAAASEVNACVIVTSLQFGLAVKYVTGCTS